MTEPEHFDLISGKCNCIFKIISEAEMTTDTARARDLYGKAFRITDDIIIALRGRMKPGDEMMALVKSAA